MDTLLGDANDAYPGPERPNDADPGRAAWGPCIASTGVSMGCWLLLFYSCQHYLKHLRWQIH